MRKYIRHPSDIPIEVSILSNEADVPHSEPLNNISEGGLSFHSDIYLEIGSMISIKIPLVEPEFETRGRVTWCKQENNVFDVGVEILGEKQIFQTRMVEQICHIEHYKNEVLVSEGRKLSGRDAAMEWIKKYAHIFPDTESMTGTKK